MSHSNQSTDGSLKKVVVFEQVTGFADLSYGSDKPSFSIEKQSYWSEQIFKFQQSEKGRFCFTNSARNPEIIREDELDMLRICIVCFFDGPAYSFYKLKFGNPDYHEEGDSLCVW